MAAWFIPALKAILPHIGTIVSATTPVFTKKHLEAAHNQNTVLQEQIAELQAAVAQNSVHIKELAEQVQSTVATLEQAATLVESRLDRAQTLSTAAIVLAALALCVALVAVFIR